MLGALLGLTHMTTQLQACMSSSQGYTKFITPLKATCIVEAGCKNSFFKGQVITSVRAMTNDSISQHYQLVKVRAPASACAA